MAKDFTIRIEPVKGDNKRKAVVYVPLAGQHGEGKEAKLYLSDFAKLIAEHGCLLNWTYNSNRGPDDPTGQHYVKAKSLSRGMASGRDSKEYVMVSWLLLGIWKEDRKEVKYLDDNRLNLCRDNLRKVDKGTSHAARKAKGKA